MRSTKTESLELIKALSEAKAPSGFEDASIAVAGEFAETFAAVEEDHLRNLYVTPKKSQNSDKPVFMLDAHGDEVGMMIQIPFRHQRSWCIQSLTLGFRVLLQQSQCIL